MNACAKDPYEEYIKFFKEVYDTMQENYYQPVSPEAYDRFIEKFRTKIYAQLKGEKKTDDYVRWRSASYLIKDLKTSEDIFSEFYPPQPAQEYKQQALAVRINLGIQGELAQEGFYVKNVEPHSDAYEKGLRIHDIILFIDGKDIKGLSQQKIEELLNPVAESQVKFKYLCHGDQLEKEMSVTSKEYFQQTVFMVPVPAEGVYCLEVRHFNKKTSEELLRYLQYFKQEPFKGLILDLRGNPGGPPLAAREISSFFLKGGDQFAYFQRKEEKKSWLDVPTIPEKFQYEGPLVILVDQKSGSASELFAGILQRRNRAVLMGTNSAGQVMLKSMYNLEDGSMVLLVTARGHHPDGAAFSFQGLTPDRYVGAQENDNILKYATNYLLFKDKLN